MPLDLYTNMPNVSREGAGAQSVVRSGSTIVVLNTDLTAATGSALHPATDPWKVVAGVSENHGNIRPIGIPQMYQSLDLYACWADDVITVDADPKVRVFGRVPWWMGYPSQHNREWPEDVAKADNDGDHDGFQNVGETQTGMWIPLPDDGGNYLLTLDTSVLCRYTTEPGGRFNIGGETRVPLPGVDRVLVTVDTAMSETFATSSSSSSRESQDLENAVLLGRLVG